MFVRTLRMLAKRLRMLAETPLTSKYHGSKRLSGAFRMLVKRPLPWEYHGSKRPSGAGT